METAGVKDEAACVDEFRFRFLLNAFASGG
jgi:hypothetical protein